MIDSGKILHKTMGLYEDHVEPGDITHESIKDLHGILDAYLQWSGCFGGKWRADEPVILESFGSIVIDADLNSTALRKNGFEGRPTLEFRAAQLVICQWDDPIYYQPILYAINMCLDLIILEKHGNKVTPLHPYHPPEKTT
jgi:hypothetical protein